MISLPTTRSERTVLGACVALTMVAAACGGSHAPMDSGTDGGTPADVDGGSQETDAGSDAGSDAGTDAGPDLCADVVCTALSACHEAGTCDPATGECSNPVAADGTACDDGAACTANDACVEGVCVGSEPATDGTLCPCGACVDGECGLRGLGATRTGDGTPSPISLAVDDTRAYFGNSGAGHAGQASVGSLPLTGGSATALAGDLTGYPSLTLVDGTLYYTLGPAVWSVPTDGSAAPTALFTGGGAGFAAIISDGARLYLTTGAAGNSVVSMELTGGAPTPLATGEAAPLRMVTDGARLYWINSGDGTIRAMPVAGGTPVTIAAGTAPLGLAVDSTHVYWTEPTTGEVLWAPLDTGVATPLATEQAQPYAIMLFGGRVYWTNYNSGVYGAVMSVDPAGGEPAAVPGNPFAPAVLAHDAECIYVLHAGVGSVSSAPAR